MDDFIKEYEEITRETEEFYKDKKYMKLIDNFMTIDVNNDDYSEPRKWTDEVDQMFDFLFDNAEHIEDFDDTIAIEHNGQFIELFEIHGQGCFRRITPLTEKPEICVEFKDIVAYEEFKSKPMRTEVLETVNMALDSLDIVSEKLELGIDIDRIKHYLKINLK